MIFVFSLFNNPEFQYLWIMTIYLILFVYLCVTVFTSLKIGKSILLSQSQKRINISLNILIPVLWYYLIKPVIFQKDRIITKEEREKMIQEQNGSKLSDNTYHY